MWNSQKEQRRNELAAELEALDTERKGAREALAQLLVSVSNRFDESCVDRVISYADAIRDALAPFDSGVREAKPSAGREQCPTPANRPMGGSGPNTGHWSGAGMEW